MPFEVDFRQAAALVAPLVLIPAMFWTYRAGQRRFGYPLGYLLAFVVYWVIWCVALPAALLGGWPGLAGLFQPFTPLRALGWQDQLLLAWPLLFPLLFVLLPRRRQVNGRVLAASLALGVVIGVTEEVLWRGVYARLFAGQMWFGLVYPTVLFAAWHLAPQSVVPNRLPGGSLSFVLYAAALGASYAVVTAHTGSIAWPTISHIIHDSLGLGGLAYAAWLSPKGAHHVKASIVST
jgi:uncharacterized protein